jgi:hypothetical protein
MFVAAWSFDLQFGSREEAMRVLQQFMPQVSEAFRAKASRMLLGSIGAPESRVVIQHDFASLADLEASWEALRGQGAMFKEWVGAIKPHIVAGTPRWEIYRVLQ